MAIPPHALAVTGLGLASSLGLSVSGACAAARAGITRPRPLAFKAIDPDTKDQEQVAGHPIGNATEGFEGTGRLLRILQLAAADLRAGLGKAQLPLDQCGLVVALPEANRATLPPLDEKGQPEEYENTLPGALRPALSRDVLLERLRGYLGLAIPASNLIVMESGHAALGALLAEAQPRLASGEWKACLILAAESWLDPPSLQWLDDHGRLKCSANPVGYQPGEAGFAALLEPLAAPHRRPQALITGSATAHDPAHQRSGEPPLGRGLAQALHLLGQSLPEGITTPWVINDLNGEVRRAMDWGQALVRAVDDHDSLRGVQIQFPAANFGDTGVASGGLGLCLAARAFARKYAPSDQAVIVSSADDGLRSAVCVAAPPEKRP